MKKPNLPTIKFSEQVTDYTTMLYAVSLNGIALQYASEELQDNDMIAVTAVNCNFWAVKHISDRLKANKPLMLSALKRNGELLQYLPHFADDRDFVEVAIKDDGVNIEHASKRLRNNKELALIAIEENNFCVRYLSEELRANAEVAIASLSKSAQYKEFFSTEIKTIYESAGIEGLNKLLFKQNLNEELAQKPHRVNKKI